MREKAVNNSGSGVPHGLLAMLALQKKKSITAACLLIIMSLLWVRIFASKSPREASAGEGQIIPNENSALTVENIQKDETINLIELPKIEGRNDRLSRDFFTVKGGLLSQFNAGGNINERIIKKIESRLVLDLIITGADPQAFINNKLYEIGDRIDISDGNQTYNCMIENIHQTEVLIDYSGVKIKLVLEDQSAVIDQ